MTLSPAVLVVDDFMAMRDIIVRQLKALGITNILTASSGGEALKLLELKPVRLILSDWSMPGMSGLELLERVRGHAPLSHLPFILITAETQRDRIEQAIRAGVDDFLLKPFKPEEFARKVTGALAGRVPAAARPAAAADKPAATPAAPPTVLVVDDTPANLTLAAGLLKDDYQVKLAPRGDKALQLCEVSPPDLVLLDVMMPDMDGFEVCRRLKDNAATAHIPVIFLTAVDDVARTVEGLELGAVDYVAKPIEPAILKARVATALRISRAHEALREQYDLALENARLREEVEHITRHDLKNPLSAVIMAASLLDDGTLGDEQRRQVKTIESAAYGMLDLIHLSSDLLKMEQGRYQLNPQPVDLAALLARVAEENRLAFSARGIAMLTELRANAPAGDFQGDPLLLYSMLHNLAKNAAEAVRDGETVRLELAGGEDWEIRIRNPGQVPAEVRDRFFEKFATHGKEKGSGLGTYSAKLVAEAHGGVIRMETSAEAGTVVTVGLPRTPT